MTAQLSADSELGDDVGGRGTGARSESLSGAARKTTRLHLPGMSQSNTRSLFIFSEDNFIRKYAQLIIEWGYPFSLRSLSRRRLPSTARSSDGNTAELEPGHWVTRSTI